MKKEYRLTQRSDFSKVYRLGRSSANRQFVIYYMPHRETMHFKLGISISKKIGNAVVRNRLKRQIKEIVRHETSQIATHFNIVIIVRKSAVTMDYHQLRHSIIHIMKKTGLWNKAQRN